MWNVAKGDRVVCIKDTWKCSIKLQNVPRKGEEYTVRGFIEEDDVVGILLEEIINDNTHEWGESGFNVDSFKRVFNNDISVFERLLENLPEDKLIKV